MKPFDTLDKERLGRLALQVRRFDQLMTSVLAATVDSCHFRRMPELTVLGIETSCDETAVAVVTGGAGRPVIRANLVQSQLAEHAPYGGVVPEIAARAHLDHLDRLIGAALAEAEMGFGELDGVAAAAGPGLIGGLIVGTMAAKGDCLGRAEAVRRGQPPRSACADRAAVGRGRVPLPGAAGLGRAFAAAGLRRGRRVPPARHHPRRCRRRSLRQERQAARAAAAGRAGDRAGGARRQPAAIFAAAAAQGPRGLRFLVLRAQDRDPRAHRRRRSS